jgi:long-chain acyl-CoA synthetase
MQTAPAPNEPGARSLSVLLDDLPFDNDDVTVASESGGLTLGELRERSAALARTLREAGIAPGHPVGNLVTPGPSSVVAMFATWAAGGVYVPINARYTAAETRALLAETPIALIVGSAAELDRHEVAIGAVEHDYASAAVRIRRPADAGTPAYEPDISLVLRTSGTTGRPKAVLLRHSGTIDALDASLLKLRRSVRPAGNRPKRLNLIPVSLALWAGVFNTLFSFRAGFGVALLDRFTTAGFAAAVKEHQVQSVVLAPAMISMLAGADDVTDLSPLRMVRSITAPLSPEATHRFHERFGVFVLNCYGQTELGGEVAGWTAADVREFGLSKLGAAGRPYQDVDIEIRGDDGTALPAGQTGEIYVRSPYRMRGYALANGALADAADDRLVAGYLRTGDFGWLDADGFLWVHGRVSDMINRGGLKVYPDEVEEALREHPLVADAGVAGASDDRLGEVPHAWVVVTGPVTAKELQTWCRQRLAPYKVPARFNYVTTLPRSDIGKLLRHQLAAGASAQHS